MKTIRERKEDRPSQENVKIRAIQIAYCVLIATKGPPLKFVATFVLLYYLLFNLSLKWLKATNSRNLKSKKGIRKQAILAGSGFQTLVLATLARTNRQHTLRRFLQYPSSLNCLLYNKMSTTSVRELGYLFLASPVCNRIAPDLDVLPDFAACSHI